MKRIKQVLPVIIAVILSLHMLSGSAFAQVENKLYFSNVGNKLYYHTSRFEEARFMYHVEMSPGNTFHDELLIQNASSLPYDLYFQIIPVTQTDIADELLEYLDMKLYLDGVLMYDGKVTGKNYSEDDVNLQQLVSLGEYLPGKQSLMKVDLKFSSEYPATQEVWSRIDWKFWGVGEDKVPKPIEPNPKTGDNQEYMKLVGMAATAFAVLVILFSTASAKRKKKVKSG